MFVHTHIYIYTHVYIYIYIHMYMCNWLKSRAVQSCATWTSSWNVVSRLGWLLRPSWPFRVSRFIVFCFVRFTVLSLRKGSCVSRFTVLGIQFWKIREVHPFPVLENLFPVLLGRPKVSRSRLRPGGAASQRVVWAEMAGGGAAHTLPYSTLPYPTLPYPTLPYPTLPYPTLPYPGMPPVGGALRVVVLLACHQRPQFIHKHVSSIPFCTRFKCTRTFGYYDLMFVFTSEHKHSLRKGVTATKKSTYIRSTCKRGC